MKKILKRLAIVIFAFGLMLLCFGFTCKPQYIDKIGGVWKCEEPDICLDCEKINGELKYNGVTYELDLGIVYNGCYIHIYAKSKIKEKEYKNDDDMLLKADTVWDKKDTLTLTITKDNLTEDVSWLGKKIVLTFTPTDKGE